MEGLFATLPFDSVDEICCVYHSYEASLAERFHGASYLPYEQSPLRSSLISLGKIEATLLAGY